MTTATFQALYEAAEKEMERIHPTWNPNTLTWAREHVKIMRRLAAK